MLPVFIEGLWHQELNYLHPDIAGGDIKTLCACLQLFTFYTIPFQVRRPNETQKRPQRHSLPSLHQFPIPRSPQAPSLSLRRGNPTVGANMREPSVKHHNDLTCFTCLPRPTRLGVSCDVSVHSSSTQRTRFLGIRIYSRTSGQSSWAKQ